MRLAASFAAAFSLVAAVPSPESHFGHKMGEDRKLIAWDQTVAYFQALDEASDRLELRGIGKSTGGRPMIAAFVSSPANLRRIDQIRAQQARLSDPAGTTAADAEALARSGKTVVMITCSIHSTEVASTLTAAQFAYRMLTEENPKFAAILDHVLLILVPSQNPDGIDIVKKWYDETLGTPYEGKAPPELYQKYVGHDNNRDWYIFSQVETRNLISKLHNVWHPQIVYDVHQQRPYGSRIFIPPWMDPIDPNVDPILTQTANMIGMGMAYDLTAAGRKGVVVNASYDFWTPARHYQAYHGGIRILSESASAQLASPITVTAAEINRTAPGYRPRESSWNYLEPWLGGEWRISDIITDQQIAWESCLYQAAVRRQDLLRGFYEVHRKAAARREPYAFVIPAKQRDPGVLRHLLETLRFGLVEIETATAPFTAGGKQYAAGTFVIRMQQPYSSFAKTLLEKQNYPDLRLYPGGPPQQPYDVTAHTLPMLMGVEVDTVKDQFQASTGPVMHFTGMPSIDASFVMPAGAKRRIGIYKSYQPSIDEGWTRWMFEHLRIPYTSVRNAEIIAGNLNARFDVILFPDQSPGVINNGYRPGAMPPGYVGGLGDQGAASLKAFAEAGGTLIFLNEATKFAVGHIGMPVRDVLAGISSREYYAPGSLLNVKLDRSHPLARDVPAEIAVWNEASPAWDVPQGSPARVIARYPDSGVLASGWLLGEKYVAGKAALVEVPMGKGRAVLFGMRPQYRAQSYLTFRLLFNALLP
jgi:hypothetical protein